MGENPIPYEIEKKDWLTLPILLIEKEH